MTTIKPETAGARDKAVERFTLAHAHKRFYLADEPWITVVYKDGTFTEVGIRKLLNDAHLISDLAEEYPLVRAALRRYLTAQVTQMMRLTGQIKAKHWLPRIAQGRVGFTSEEVETLLGDQREYLYLLHPETPFLQDMQLLAGKMQPVAARELIPHIPGDSESAWLDKQGDPSMSRGLTAADSARYLTTAWFYTFIGNKGGGSKGSLGAAAGTTTNVFRVDSRAGLFATLLRNVTDHTLLTDAFSLVHGPAWMLPQPPQPFGDGLYKSTLTATGVLLGQAGADDDGEIRFGEMVKGTTFGTLTKEDVATSLKDAQENDPHRFWMVSAKGDRERFIQDPDAYLSPILLRIRRKPCSSFGVASTNGLAIGGHYSSSEHLELLLGKSQGMQASPKWAAVETQSVSPSFFDTTHPQAHMVGQSIGDQLDRADASVISVCKKAFTRTGGRSEESLVISATSMARAYWYAEADRLILMALASPTPPLPQQIGSDLRRAARNAVLQALSPYSATPTWARSVARAVAVLPQI